MRLLNLILGDILFQKRYGFYILYLVFTIVYLLLLNVLPSSARPMVSTLIIFLDPCALGLFFMGALVLLEKSERVLHSLTASPIRIHEYIFAKILSLGFISLLVALPLTLFNPLTLLPLVVVGTSLASIFCSLCALIIAMRINTLNQFLIAMIPLELFIFVPAICYLLGFIDTSFGIIHPGIAAIRLIEGNTDFALLAIISLLLWCMIAFSSCNHTVSITFKEIGGGN